MHRRLRVLVLALVVVAGLAVFAAGSAVAANAVTLVGTINGGGTAQMEDGMGQPTGGWDQALFRRHRQRVIRLR